MTVHSPACERNAVVPFTVLIEKASVSDGEVDCWPVNDGPPTLIDSVGSAPVQLRVIVPGVGDQIAGVPSVGKVLACVSPPDKLNVA